MMAAQGEVMDQKVVKLGALAFALFLASLTLFILDNRKSVGILEGSYFISGLDVGKVRRFVIAEDDKNKVSFTREGKAFFIDSHHSFPASTKKVNDLLFKISNNKALKKISSSTSDHKEYGVTEDDATWKVTFFDKDGNSSVEYFVGKNYKGKGHYIRHAGQDDVFLSDGPIFYSIKPISYVENKVFDFSFNNIARLEYAGKEKFNIAYDTEKKDLIVEQQDSEKIDPKKIRGVISRITSTRLTDYHLNKATEVMTLNYDTEIKIQLKNHINYVLALAKGKDKYYFKVSSIVNEVPQQIQISTNADKTKLQDVENLITARGKAQTFNLKHGNWVYEMNKNTYERYILSLKDFQKEGPKS